MLKKSYENVSEISATNVHMYKAIDDIYQMLSDNVELLSTQKSQLDKTWLVKSEYKNIKKSELPFIPHIDKRRLLKVMIYMCDVGLENGPLTLANAKPEKYEKFRLNLPVNYKENKLNAIDSPLDYSSVVGRMGDAVLFDTNCPHFANKISKGLSRKVIRFDYLVLNYESRLKKVMKKFKLQL